MNKPKPQKYRTTNWSSYNASLKSRGSLDVWFDPSMSWFATPSGKIGRAHTLSRRQKQINIDIPYQTSQNDLHLLVDSKVVQQSLF